MENKKYNTAHAVKYLVEHGIFTVTANKASNEVKLRKWRSKGKGPAFVKLSTGGVYYTQSAIDDYIAGKNSAEAQ
jgi:hypothetical protein